MSAIETYLQYIASKVWARDVRTAIVNAIRQCYDDVHNPTLNTQALQAAIQAKIDAGQMAALTIGDRTITAAKLALGVIPTPDTTLSQSGVPADAKAAGDAISTLRDALNTLADITPIPDNSDLNNYDETGLYSIENSNYTILNYPDSDGIKTVATLEVFALTTGYIQQVMTQGAGRMFARVRYGNGNWQDWVQITRKSEYNVTPIPDNSDLNDYTETGLYSIEDTGYTILHYPRKSVIASYLEVTALTTGYIAQKMTLAGVGVVYVRRRTSNNAWNEWIQIAKDVSIEKGLTTEIISAILNAFDNVAWSNPNGRQYYNALYNALNGVEYPKINAVLSLGANKVFPTDSVDILRQYLTVTYYESSSSAGIAITNYTINGNLSDGTNQVNVQYVGLSALVSVPVTDFYNVFRWTAQDNRYSIVRGSVERVDVDSTINRVVVVNEGQNSRRVLGLSFGVLKLVNSSALQPVNVYPIPIPDTATGVKVTYTTKTGRNVKYVFDTITRHSQSDDYYYLNSYGSWLSSGETTTIGASGTPNRWGIVAFDGNEAESQKFSDVQIDFLTGE